MFTFFWGVGGENGIYSQWYPSSFVDDNKVRYNCAEQYMMAEKARAFGDAVTLKMIMKSRSPREQKKLGRKVIGFQKGKWNSMARQVVYRGNYFKFTQNLDLREKLLESKGELVEASPHDKIWGIGLREDHPAASNKKEWKGKNWLGQTLTQLRADLLASSSTVE